MERFGDDLTEHVLQYLSLSDKLRLECVSKQWKNAMIAVFWKEFVIELSTDNPTTNHNSLNEFFRLYMFRQSDDHLYEQRLELVLKKCPNITTVRLGMNVTSEMLSLFGRYCPQLKSLSYPCNNDKQLSFFSQYGRQLETLDLSESIDNTIFTSILQFCPNLKRVKLRPNFNLISNDKEFLPKLEEFGCHLKISSNNINQMKKLTDKYSQTLKILNLLIIDLSAEELKTCIECISRFENLKELKLMFHRITTTKPIDDCLSLIGQKCCKLLKLDILIVDVLVPISERFFNVFTHFKSIKKLKICLPHIRVLSGSVECFKHCKQLEELDIKYQELREEFFVNIDSFVPKLQLLSITTEKQFSNSFINLFQSMKYIQKVQINNQSNRLHKNDYYFGKSLSEVMLSPNGMNVKQINDDCGLLLSNIL